MSARALTRGAGLDDALSRLPGELRPLVSHVVTENDRVRSTVDLLRAGRLAETGTLLNASHDSLRDDYRVSCLELDVAVDAARAADNGQNTPCRPACLPEISKIPKHIPARSASPMPRGEADSSPDRATSQILTSASRKPNS